MSSSGSVPPALTEEQIYEASRYLSDTRDALAESVAGISDPQWDFKPSPACWSIAEVIEHLVLIENGIHGIISTIGEAPRSPASLETLKVDEFIRTQIPKRSKKQQSPPQLYPARRWSGPEGLNAFLQSRQQTIGLLSSPSLRGHVVPHPFLGPWDGYQWLLLAAAHCARHTTQIREIKADPNFT